MEWQSYKDRQTELKVDINSANSEKAPLEQIAVDGQASQCLSSLSTSNETRKERDFEQRTSDLLDQNTTLHEKVG